MSCQSCRLAHVCFMTAASASAHVKPARTKRQHAVICHIVQTATQRQPNMENTKETTTQATFGARRRKTPSRHTGRNIQNTPQTTSQNDCLTKSVCHSGGKRHQTGHPNDQTTTGCSFGVGVVWFRNRHFVEANWKARPTKSNRNTGVTKTTALHTHSDAFRK